MYVYIKSETRLYTVGFYDPAGKWHPDGDYDNRDQAAARVHYLNGGQSDEPDAGSWGEYQHIKETTFED